MKSNFGKVFKKSRIHLLQTTQLILEIAINIHGNQTVKLTQVTYLTEVQF